MPRNQSFSCTMLFHAFAFALHAADWRRLNVLLFGLAVSYPFVWSTCAKFQNESRDSTLPLKIGIYLLKIRRWNVVLLCTRFVNTALYKLVYTPRWVTSWNTVSRVWLLGFERETSLRPHYGFLSRRPPLFGEQTAVCRMCCLHIRSVVDIRDYWRAYFNDTAPCTETSICFTSKHALLTCAQVYTIRFLGWLTCGTLYY